ncbi:MAG: hypothetical protein QM500_09735, partial [Methylococcales bacterium]
TGLTSKIEEQRFKAAEDAIKYRCNLHYQEIQPALHESGIRQGVECSCADIKKALGELLYERIKSSTEQVVYHVDRTVESGDNLRKTLIEALKETYPDKEFVNFVPLEETLDRDPRPIQ